MGLKLYNQRPKSEIVMGLYLTPMAQIKTCVASIGGGGLAAGSAFGGSICADFLLVALKFASMPASLTVTMVTLAFLGTVDYIEDKMIARAMKNGDVTIKSHRRPKIDL